MLMIYFMEGITVLVSDNKKGMLMAVPLKITRNFANGMKTKKLFSNRINL